MDNIEDAIRQIQLNTDEVVQAARVLETSHVKLDIINLIVLHGMTDLYVNT